MSLITINQETKKTIPWRLVVIFICFSVAIILAGIIFYKSQRIRLFRQVQDDLTAIASLKVNQIEQWYSERLGDAAVIRDNGPLINRIKQYFGDADNQEIKTEINGWMKSIFKEYDYRGVLILDTALKVRLSVDVNDTTAGDTIIEQLRSVFRNRTIIMTDLHTAKCISYVHIDILIPLIDRTGRREELLGAVILRIDPGIKLFPLIQSWPTPSKSSETLLLRIEKDSVLYLNELRHQKNTALKLKFPLTNKNLLATKAVKGYKGVVEGVDYKNIPVVGYLTGISGLNWFIVAKVAKEEIQAPVRRYFIISVIVILLLILINASVFIFWIWSQRVRFYRNQLSNERSIRESEEKLHESEKLFRSLFENMLNGFAYCKMIYKEDRPYDFIYLKVNAAFESLTGLKNVEGRKVSDVIPGIQEADPEIIERYGRVSLTGIPEVFDIYVDSLEMWFSISVYSPQKEYFVAVFDVITDRKKADEALRESEDKFKYFFDHSVTGKSITFLSGEIQVNKSFCEMLGYTQKEMGKTKWQDISHPDDLELTQKQINSLISGEITSSRFIKRYIHKDGSVIWADIGTSLRRDENGNPIYFMTSTNNITQQKLAEEEIYKLNEELEQRVIERTKQLEDANRELEAFSYSVSHDLRAPLRSVHGYTKILMEEYENKLDDEGKRICGIISSSATQMGGLIDDLLSFSRIGRSSPNPLLLDMKSMVLSVFADICSNEEKSGITLKVGKLHKAYGDANLIRLVWINLISNAIKYSSKANSSEISISSSLKDHSITYSVMDNGVGFDMQYKHKLFGVFQRLHSGSEFEGNGVGLAIVQRIVLKHGGKVKAEGEVGKGATFCFSLPTGGKGPMPDASQ